MSPKLRPPEMILGIDEAGRGPVLGPLVLCGVWVSPAGQRRLDDIGVRDSKAFGSTDRARRRRLQLAAQIRGLAGCVTLLCVDADEVDRRARIGELNLLEQELASAMIDAGPPARRIIADGSCLFGPLGGRYPRLSAEDRADQHHVAVAAASIVAKAERDARFEELMAALDPGASLGPVRGGGYVNGATASFLRAYYQRHGCLPPHLRRSWSWSVLRDLLRLEAGKPPVRPPDQLPLI